jgi:Mg2+ and Co2+ transporter CorA
VRQAEASHEIAEAAKKDSSDMKTIAIMTMAFLPATFLAALFAIPSLDWQSDNVIQSNHWVYWAFTIPATILDFFSWYLLNQRALLRRLRPHNRKNGPSATK